MYISNPLKFSLAFTANIIINIWNVAKATRYLAVSYTNNPDPRSGVPLNTTPTYGNKWGMFFV